MRKSAASLLLLLPLCAQAFAQKPAQKPPATQDDDEVIRVETTLVTLHVSVTEGGRRFVPGLRREQFRLFEDGAEQEIAYFESADQPFTVALLLDLSDSARLKRDEIKAAARAFAEQLRPADRLILVAFDKNVSVLTGPTNDPRVISAALERLKTGGGTSLYDAVDRTLRERLGRGRKAVVLFTDGVDTASRATYHDTLLAAEEADALVYSIQYDTINYAARAQLEPLSSGQTVTNVVTPQGLPLSEAYKRGNLYLRLLSDKTGGRFFHADTVEKLSRSFSRIAGELREQYSLGYYPKARGEDGRVRKLKVSVDAPGATVRSRKGYVYKPRRGAREGRRPAGRLARSGG